MTNAATLSYDDKERDVTWLDSATTYEADSWQLKMAIHRALKILEIPSWVDTGANNPRATHLLFTIEEGHAAVKTLLQAHRVVGSTSVPGIAKKFEKRPDVMQHFDAAARLGADRKDLKQILKPLWR